MNKEYIEMIENAYDTNLKDANLDVIKNLVEDIIEELNAGNIRVAENKNDSWVVNQWVKKAILLSFKFRKNQVTDTGYTKFYDKLDSRFKNIGETYLKENNIRIVPQAIAREGTFVGKNVVLMPSFINIGAYVDSGTMVDTWVTVG